MKGIAEFVMRGRFQALFVVVLGAASSLFCWISAAAIALVTLRKGAGAGIWLLMWALLPAGTLAYVYGDTAPGVLLIGTTLLALILRVTVSLPLAVLASVLVGLVAGFVAVTLGSEYVAQVVEMFDRFIGSMEQRRPEGVELTPIPRPDALQVAGLLGTGTAVMAVCSVLLARYWQAALYNPGGFGKEFRELRFPIGAALALVLAGLMLSSVGLSWRAWAMLCFIPLSFAGLALVHAWVARRGRPGSGLLTGFYIAWVLLEPLKLMVMFVAIADSFIDFRKRWEQRAGSAHSGKAHTGKAHNGGAQDRRLGQHDQDEGERDNSNSDIEKDHKNGNEHDHDHDKNL